MPKSLPEKPCLERLKNEAKALLHAHQRGDPTVCETLRLHHRFTRASPEEVLSASLSLQEVQHAVALEYGFKDWKALKSHVDRESAFAARLAETAAIFASKGPAHNSTGSEWDKARKARIGEMLEAGDEGFRIMEQLSRSDNGRVSGTTHIYFALSKDPRSTDVLRRLMRDERANVRAGAIRFYAIRIHPGPNRGDYWVTGDKATSIPDGLEAIVAYLSDESSKVRFEAARQLSVYIGTGDERVESAFRERLRDTDHTIRHLVAETLGVACPNCRYEGSAKAERKKMMKNLKRGLAAWYRLNGNVNDASGNSNHGSLQGEPTYVADRSGKETGALDFGSRKDNVLIQDSPSLKLGPSLTLAAWINPRSLGLTRIVNKWEGQGGGAGAAYNLGTDHHDEIWFEIDGEARKHKEVIVRVDASDFVNKWHHIAGVYDGVCMRLLIDGEEVGNEPFTVTPNQADIPLYIGTGDGEEFTFDGAISDVRIYSRALDDAEIRVLAGRTD